jgi:hypothetical protein
MAWNYRVMFDGDEYSVREVYYDDGGYPRNWTAEGISVTGLTLSELNDTLELMKLALDKEVITV